MFKRTTIHVLAAAALVAVLPAGIASPRRTPVVEAVQKALPSVVNIGTEKLVQVRYTDPIRRARGDLFDALLRDMVNLPLPPASLGYQLRHSLGSGVLVHEDGFILTNYHVIQRATRIEVTLADSQTFEARLVAADELSDLALIRIDSDTLLPAISFADDDDLYLGETVVVLGNPYGLGHTVTVGVLSATNREATYQGEVLFRDIMQTDAAVNPGSSGGPLINLDGNMIGVNVAIHREAQNIGFALPVKRIRTLLEQWLSPELMNRIWLGFEISDDQGYVQVRAIDPDGPASDSPLKVGDLVVSVNGEFVRSRYDFNRMLTGAREGDVIDVEIDRQGQRRWVALNISGLPMPPGVRSARQRLGIEFGPGQVEGMPGIQGAGIPVEGIVPDSPADEAGLKPGIFVVRINDVVVQDTHDLGLALAPIRGGDTVQLELVMFDQRQGRMVLTRSTASLVAAGVMP